MSVHLFTATLLALATSAGSAIADPDDTQRFQAHVFRNARGQTLPYRLFVPAGYDAAKKYPLVLWLHGGGGRGSDNVGQLAEGNAPGVKAWAKPENQARFPSFVVAPQCPRGAMWTSIGNAVEISDPLRLVVELLAQLSKDFSIDADRLYVAGQSMGGFATWALLAAYPDRFAAAVPVCGGGDERHAPRLARVPIWAFHGELDEAVSVERSRRMVAAVRRAGGKPRYTEYKGVGHFVWHQAFAEAELLPWVFAQTRTSVR